MSPPPVTPKRIVAGRVLAHRRPQRPSKSAASTSRDKENVPPVFSTDTRVPQAATVRLPPTPTQTFVPPPSTQPRTTLASTDDEDAISVHSDDPLQEDIDMLHALDANASEAIREATGTQEFYEQACTAARFLGLYPNLLRVLTEGLAKVVDNTPLEERPLYTSDEYTPSVETDLLWDVFEIFLPKVVKCAPYILRHDDLIARLAHYLELITKYVRGNDLQRLKNNILKVANIADPDQVLEEKANRGWKAKPFAELLVPLTDLEEFRADPEGYCNKVEREEKFILSDDWPVCFYDLKKVQPGKAKPGFLMSPFVERCYKWLITGKGTVFEQINRTNRSVGRRSVARNGKIKFVTLPSILYVACIGRHCLTSMTAWSDVDGAHWSGEDFVKSVYQAAFHDPDWADELEDWWTKRIYGPSDEEGEELVAKRKDTALKRFLQESEGGNPRKRVKPNAPRPSDDRQPGPSTSA